MQVDCKGININFMVSKSWENSKITESEVLDRGYPLAEIEIWPQFTAYNRHRNLGPIPPFSTKPELITTPGHKFSNHLACKPLIYNL